MLLRRSGEVSEESYNLEGVTGAGEVGVPHEAILIAIAEAVFYEDTASLGELRANPGGLSNQQLVDAIGVAAAFNGITKVANATGIPLDDRTEETTRDLRQATGIDDYSDEFKSKQYG